MHIYKYPLRGRDCVSLLPVSLLSLEISCGNSPIRLREATEQLEQSLVNILEGRAQ